MIVVIDYKIGNVGSVVNALDTLGVENIISSDPEIIEKANAIILPGVGAAGTGMKNLKKNGLDKVVIDEIKKGKPFLGICLGMQLLFEKSEEGNAKCLGIFKGTVKKFKKERKIPQIGWNKIENQSSKIKDQKNRVKIENLFREIPNNGYFYFVNSYYCDPKDASIVAGKTTYGETFASIVEKDNIIGVQFHPEKSGDVGFRLLKNFIKNYVN